MKKRGVSIFNIVVFTLLSIYAISIVFMFLWAINASLMNEDVFAVSSLKINFNFEFSNYINAFFFGFQVSSAPGVYIEDMFVNSLLYAMGGAFLQTFCTCIVAYLIAKYDNWFSRLMHNVIIFTLILPIVGALPSQIEIMRGLGILDTLPGMWLMKFGFTNTYYLIFYGAFKSLSWGYAEAAFIDGANHFQIFFKIMMPLVSSLFGVTFIIFFIQYWNDYQVPMLFWSSKPVLAWGLFEFFQSYDNVLSTTVVKIAGGVIVLLPLLLLFAAFRKKLMGNLTEGGLKS